MAHCRFCQCGWRHSVVTVGRDSGTASLLSVGRDGSLTACTPQLIVQFMLLLLRIMIGCLQAALLCFTQVPSHVLMMCLTCLPDTDEAVGSFKNYLYCCTGVSTEGHLEIAVRCLAVSGHL
jgi:hypothetical protein